MTVTALLTVLAETASLATAPYPHSRSAALGVTAIVFRPVQIAPFSLGSAGFSIRVANVQGAQVEVEGDIVTTAGQDVVVVSARRDRRPVITIIF